MAQCLAGEVFLDDEIGDESTLEEYITQDSDSVSDTEGDLGCDPFDSDSIFHGC